MVGSIDTSASALIQSVEKLFANIQHVIAAEKSGGQVASSLNGRDAQPVPLPALFDHQPASPTYNGQLSGTSIQASATLIDLQAKFQFSTADGKSEEIDFELKFGEVDGSISSFQDDGHGSQRGASASFSAAVMQYQLQVRDTSPSTVRAAA